jgi:beta-lactamase class A
MVLRRLSRRTLLTIGGAVLVVVAFGAGYGVRELVAMNRTENAERQANRLSRLTSPFLECVGEMNADQGLVRIRSELVRLIREAQARDTSLRASVYVRDLNNGPWIGIDESAAEFEPASLWKVPLMMYILSQAEADPALLERELTFPGAEHMTHENSLVGAPTSLNMRAGEKYTYRDLLFRMIAFSDNYAEELLLTGIGKANVDQLLQSINAEDTYMQGRPYVTARTYAALFRVLYNSTLFSRSTSEHALGLLTQSFLQGGVRKYLPKDVKVASKFGVRDYAAVGRREVQFHECGIVYHPKSPYVLCVMTKSNQASVEQVTELAATISRGVWEGKLAAGS